MNIVYAQITSKLFSLQYRFFLHYENGKKDHFYEENIFLIKKNIVIMRRNVKQSSFQKTVKVNKPIAT